MIDQSDSTARTIFVVATLFVVCMVASTPGILAQSTVATGSIQGSVTDPQGAAVPNAKVTITSKDTGKVLDLVTTSSGLYNSGTLVPGVYAVRVEAPNFRTVETTVTVQVGVVSSGNVKLALGASTTIVEVSSEAVTVNTDQAQVQGIVAKEQIENLPINGRNFLDLAQLEPGVQIQDGQNFDPTKTGYSSISFGGRFGRTARIEVDGVDISDETVGTTTTSIPASAISEFQLAQSTLDLSNELTSSGAVNVVTRSGTNRFHGEGFGYFRDSTQAAALPGGATFQRTQSGGNVGGPVIGDKLFFFIDGERTVQHAGAGVPVSAPLNSFTGTFKSPFKEYTVIGKMDWQATKAVHVFYRFSDFQNNLIPSFGTASFSFFANKDRTRNHVVGADFNTGSFTHSFRFQYLKFQNNIADAVRGSGAAFANFPVALQFLVSSLSTGPSDNAPQATPQSNRQFKYDGSKIWGSHILRYGVSYNHIQGGGFAKFFGVAPLVLSFQTSTSFSATANLTCPGGQTGMSCPLNYLPDEVLIGNGQGFASEKPSFGLPVGGLGPDNRIGIYVGDSWKIKPNLTLTYGMRYVRDTGRTDSDVPAIPALNAVLPGIGNRVNNPDQNLGPQAGIAWDPWKDGKTVFRGGVGIFFENAIFNNVLFDRGPRLAKGTFFFADAVPCLFGSASPVSFADGTVRTIPGGAATCSTAIGLPVPAAAAGPTCAAGITVAQCIANFQGAYQAAAAANLFNPNPNFIGTEIANGVPLSGLIGPGYKSPRSVQINVGGQHQLRPGMVLSVDYVRNVGTHFLLSIDANHTGDAAFLNVPAAVAAINTTNAGFNGAGGVPCGTGIAGITCAIAAGATIANYAGKGLDSPGDLGIGACNGPSGIGASCAFGGINPNIGPAPILFPVARSVYNAMDIKLTQNVEHPFTGLRYLNFQATYTASRFVNTGSNNGLGAPGTPANADQDFIDNSLDNRDPLRYVGPSSLDRTHQINFGGYADFPLSIRIGLVAHFWSPLAITPTLNLPVAPGAIFQTDFTGDGTVNDPLPGFKTGAFGRDLSTSGLTKAINNYNAKVAGTTLTPAGQALVNAGLFTQPQLIALGATPPTITFQNPNFNPALPVSPSNQPTLPGVIPGQDELRWLKAFDLQLSWVGHLWHERLTVQPSVGFFNVFNFNNFDAPGNTLSGALNGGPGSINGTTPGLRSNRIGAGSGVFALGAPRVIEWGLKLTF